MRRLAGLLLVVAAACSSGSPTEPGGEAVILTRYGAVRVVAHGQAFDEPQAVAALHAGYAEAARYHPRVVEIPLPPVVVVVDPTLTSRGAVSSYEPGRDRLNIMPGVEHGLAHEVQHRLCHQLGRPEGCCRELLHPGGTDWNCARMSGSPQADE